MLVGPVFTRELTTTPRSWRLYFARALYVASLFGLAFTAWLILFGSRPVHSLGDLARFGAAVFGLLAPVQLALAVAFSALLTAAAVCQEKDRRTLDLLLMTRMTNSELVLGKLLASMLSVLVLILAAVPLLVLLTLLGGVSLDQVVRVTTVTLTAAIAAGSLGSTLALWREKTFQTLAMTALALMLWLMLGEALAAGTFGRTIAGADAEAWASAISPLRAILAAAEPDALSAASLPGIASPVGWFVLLSAAAATLLNLWSIWRVRIWNPSREARPADPANEELTSEAAGDIHAAPGKTRTVWDNPILWREVRTWAYGKKIVVVRIAYLVVFAVCTFALWSVFQSDQPAAARGAMPAGAGPLAPLMVLGLLLVNALAVTSLTNERDLKALDLLLVTDLTPKEIVYGKLAGIFYNAKEMVLLPLVLCIALWATGRMGTENLTFLIIGLAVVNGFAAMLGVHLGMMYANSRTAVAVSVGTVLFLLLGIAVCMRMMMAFQGSFDNQLQAFLAFMFGGGIGLVCAVGYRYESVALVVACMAAPFATYFVMTSFLQSNYGAAVLMTVVTYGFATAAMLVPAIDEFDIATGRTRAQDG